MLSLLDLIRRVVGVLIRSEEYCQTLNCELSNGYIILSVPLRSLGGRHAGGFGERQGGGRVIICCRGEYQR